jgi:hypothetical protein
MIKAMAPAMKYVYHGYPEKSSGICNLLSWKFAGVASGGSLDNLLGKVLDDGELGVLALIGAEYLGREEVEKGFPSIVVPVGTGMDNGYPVPNGDAPGRIIGRSSYLGRVLCSPAEAVEFSSGGLSCLIGLELNFQGRANMDLRVVELTGLVSL